MAANKRLDPAPTPRRHPAFGVIPTTPRNRFFFGWGMTNVLLALLPVWDLAGNDAAMVGGLLPVTILWSYLAFSSNFALAIAYYLVWGRPWAKAMQDSDLVQREHSSPDKPEDRSSIDLDREG